MNRRVRWSWLPGTQRAPGRLPVMPATSLFTSSGRSIATNSRYIPFSFLLGRQLVIPSHSDPETRAFTGNDRPHLPGEPVEPGDDRFPLLPLERPGLEMDLAVAHVERHQLDPLDPVVQGDPGNGAPARRVAEAAEGEVPQAVQDDPLLVALDSLEDVGVVPQHHVSAGIDSGMGGRYLVRAGR